MRLFSSLENIRGLRITENVPLANMTTFRIGGPCRLLCEPESPEAAIELFRILPELKMPYALLGNGSNTLVSDKGFDGIVIRPVSAGGAERLFGNRIRAGAGMLIPSLACFARDQGLAGLAFAQGIPGTVGGGLSMNCGAYGANIADVCESVVCVRPGGEVHTYAGSECEFGYRESIFRHEELYILEATFVLTEGDSSAIAEDMRTYAAKRSASQPLHMPSAGSVFKRPEGYFAGKLIEDAGLKGYRIGGAEVSEKHAGFIVNAGGATAADVIDLICHIQKTVYDRFGVMLEREVCILGDPRGV
ncbi:MAG: UDP-N-acetylmuramate dehydrogenase [Clostridia bacterium]|nr:UDP-N-acetylmuramate dehydrogenase [Clostridia bacterium]